MNQDLGSGWAVEIERGPDWLFISLQGVNPFDAAGIDLAAEVWQLFDREFVNRLVLEMDNVHVLRSELVGALVRLHSRITSHGGIMRISGLSDDNFAVLRNSRLHDRFPQYRDRYEAVLGYRPNKPR